MNALVPAILRQLKNYSFKLFKNDLVAGLTVSVLLIPQGMAYALLAGLPPIYGLYGSLIPTLVYPLFGSSRVLSVGPVALISILVISEIGKLAEPGTSEFIELTILASLVAGLIQVLFSVIRIGFLINFLSKPVLTGFTAAAAVIISVSQLKHILGVPSVPSSGLFSTCTALWQNLPYSHILTLLVGLMSATLLFLAKKIRPGIPAALIIVCAAIALTSLLNLHGQGVAIVGQVPSGLPSFSMPQMDWARILKIIPVSLAICLISFIESLAIAKSIASKNQNYKINADQELMALGLAKIVGAFFQAFPNTGSFSRSALSEQSGGKTGIASIVSAACVAMALLFLSGVIYYIPNCVLAAIVIISVLGLIKIKQIKTLYYLDKNDFAVMLLTFLVTICLGVQLGVFAGVVFAFLIILYKSSQPHYAILGRLPKTDVYRNIERYPEAVFDERILIFRLDASLYFGNAEYFYEKLNKEIELRLPELKAVILDGSAILDIDTTGLEQMSLIVDKLSKAGIILLAAGFLGPVRDILKKSMILDRIGFDRHFIKVHDAVQWLTEENVALGLRQNYARQSNDKE